ncbi:MAG: Stage V sporulation protein D [Eubacteriales bacterium SKADARSKE-1]|nr:Stage V sporulation protein D [Eubacteriales bacterium SKADARSKE-1]
MARGTTIRMWRRSLFILMALMFLGFGVSIARLVQLQIFQGENLQQMAIDQQLKDTKISAQRGTIYDCNMKPLAQSATVWTVVLESAYLPDNKTKELVATGLSEILELDKNEVLEKAKKKSYYTVIKRKIESDVKDKIIQFQKTNKIKSGIRLVEDYKRYYPYGDFASAVIGFTGTDSQGLSGVENYYNDYLTGESGKLVTARNAVGTDMPFDYEKMIPAKNGNSLVLSIDEVIQHFLEKNLEEGIANFNVVNKAVAIMMDVNTGDVLGMAVRGGYDLNHPFDIVDDNMKKEIESFPEDGKAKAKAEALEKQWRNKAVSDTYMPGSVFKMVTASMGLEENLVTENTGFNCSGSLVPFKGARPIRCHKHGGHGAQTFLKAFCNSCNPAFISLGQMVGAQKFYQYYDGFGFTEKTGIDLPGEANGIFFSKDGSMGPMDLAVASFGQNFSITPIQMAVAAAAVANGGYLVKPHIVKQIIDPNGNIIRTSEREVRRQVISEDTSRKLCEFLQLNAKEGGAKKGYVPGYRIGGKTGTTQKIGQSGPDGLDYIASFCGIAPADKPQVVLLVYYDTPKGGSYYGGVVAGPTFQQVMQDVLPYLGIERKYTDEELVILDIPTPFLVGSSVSEAKNKLERLGMKPVVYGSGDMVVSQIPEAGVKIPKGGTVVLHTAQDTENKTVKVPKLIGLTPSNANKTAVASGVNIVIKGAISNGAGAVSVRQSIAEGTAVKQGTAVTVEFSVQNQPTED